MQVRRRRVLVTGASSGIGAATAIRLAREGALVALTGRDAERLESVASECRDLGVPAWAGAADLAERGAATALAARAESAFGPLDAVVSCAGIPLRRGLDRLALDDVERALRVNFLAVAELLLALLPALRERSESAVVVVGSSGGRVGTPGQAAYSASKFALTGFLEVVATELAGSAVSVRLVQPGPIDTPLWDAPGNDAPLHTGERWPPELVAEAVVQALGARGGFETFVPPDVGEVVARSVADVDASLTERAAWYGSRARP